LSAPNCFSQALDETLVYALGLVDLIEPLPLVYIVPSKAPYMQVGVLLLVGFIAQVLVELEVLKHTPIES